MADDFEIIPERELSELKKEIKKVKENPFGDNETSGRFLKTVDNLNDSMSNMLNLFKIAADSMQNEEKEEIFLAEKIKPISEKVDKLLEQNEKIAKALVAIADMIDEIKTQKKVNPLDELRGKEDAPRYVPQTPSFGSGFQQPQFTPPPMGGLNQNSQNFNSGMLQSQNNYGASQMSQSNFNKSQMGLQQSQNNFGASQQQNFQPGAPSPFLEDDFSMGGNSSQNNSGLPPFSDFSGNKMSMPPPPKDMFGDLGHPNEAPKKKGLFGKK